MKKFFCLSFFALSAFFANAQECTIPADALSALSQCPAAIDFRQQMADNAIASHINRVARPEGESKMYSIAGNFQTVYGMKSASGIADEVLFNNEGKDIYVNTFLPVVGRDYWHHGSLKNGKLTFSKDDVCYVYDYHGDGSQIFNLKFGKMIYSDSGCKAEDVIFNAEDPEHIYIEDANAYLGFYDMIDGNAAFFNIVMALDLKAFTDALVTIPSTATQTEYVYSSTDEYSAKHTLMGSVAVDGDDYYFDHLSSASGVVKGTRSGDVITVKSGQYIGAESGYFLYFNGAYTDWQKDDQGYVGLSNTDNLTFLIDADGKITMENAENYLALTTNAAGAVYCYDFNIQAYPYPSDQILVPVDPHDVSIKAESEGRYKFEAILENYTADGEFINPAKMGFYFYFDDEVYTFEPDVFPCIENAMTRVPFGYCDEQSRDIFTSGNTVCINLSDDMFNTVGIKSVYTLGEKEISSQIVTVDLEGNVVVKPDAVQPVIVLQPVTNPSWYDLNGRSLNGAPVHGAFIKDGKIYIK